MTRAKVFGAAREAAVASCIFILAIPLGGAQTTPPITSQPTRQPPGSIRSALGAQGDSTPGPSPLPDTTRQKRNDERQRRLVSDTERLLVLTDQLKSEIAASGTESMTPDMLRQVDQIEKLARSVKEKMRN